MGDGQGFIVDVIVKICFPFDGVPLCVPTEDGLHLLKNQEIPICSRNFTSLLSS
jgi:hypothetical protein